MFPDTETLTALDLKGNTWCLKVEGNINNIFFIYARAVPPGPEAKNSSVLIHVFKLSFFGKGSQTFF